MEIVIEDFFKEQLQKCPVSFQHKFRKIYQQLKVVDKPVEVKSITVSKYTKNYFKLNIDESRIGMMIKSGRLHITCFLYNQYFENLP